MAIRIMTKVSLCVVVLGCTIFAQQKTVAKEQANPYGPAMNIWPCLEPVQPTLKPDIPSESLLNDQPSLNCFAWQEFIAMNWLNEGGTASNFGEPGDTSKVVFETYMNVDQFFNEDGSPPPQWGAAHEFPHNYKASHPLARNMSRTSKFSNFFDGSGKQADIHEAFPQQSPNWLADVNGNLVWYEVFINKPEYDYLVKHKYYNAIEQNKSLNAGGRLDMPSGDLSGAVGAMEFKAAWLTIEDPSAPKWKRYKRSHGVFCGKSGCKTKEVALVGLHIIHKTVSQPTWIWATFEHVDNAPNSIEVKAGKDKGNYTFYSKACTSTDVPAICTNQQKKKTSCEPNRPPLYDLDMDQGEPQGECLPYPIQVVRELPLPATFENPIVQTNHMAHKMIKASNPDSVYQFYNLVNVLWNDSPVDENKGSKPPVNRLSRTAFRPNPNAFPVSNTTMETYIQNTTCIDCHSGAQIAKDPKGKSIPYTSDYSFMPKKAGPKK